MPGDHVVPNGGMAKQEIRAHRGTMSASSRTDGIRVIFQTTDGAGRRIEGIGRLPIAVVTLEIPAITAANPRVMTIDDHHSHRNRICPLVRPVCLLDRVPVQSQ